MYWLVCTIYARRRRPFRAQHCDLAYHSSYSQKCRYRRKSKEYKLFTSTTLITPAIAMHVSYWGASDWNHGLSIQSPKARATKASIRALPSKADDHAMRQTRLDPRSTRMSARLLLWRALRVCDVFENNQPLLPACGFGRKFPLDITGPCSFTSFQIPPLSTYGIIMYETAIYGVL